MKKKYFLLSFLAIISIFFYCRKKQDVKNNTASFNLENTKILSFLVAPENEEAKLIHSANAEDESTIEHFYIDRGDTKISPQIVLANTQAKIQAYDLFDQEIQMPYFQAIRFCVLKHSWLLLSTLLFLVFQLRLPLPMFLDEYREHLWF